MKRAVKSRLKRSEFHYNIFRSETKKNIIINNIFLLLSSIIYNIYSKNNILNNNKYNIYKIYYINNINNKYIYN